MSREGSETRPGGQSTAAAVHVLYSWRSHARGCRRLYIRARSDTDVAILQGERDPKKFAWGTKAKVALGDASADARSTTYQFCGWRIRCGAEIPAGTYVLRPRGSYISLNSRTNPRARNLCAFRMLGFTVGWNTACKTMNGDLCHRCITHC